MEKMEVRELASACAPAPSNHCSASELGLDGRAMDKREGRLLPTDDFCTREPIIRRLETSLFTAVSRCCYLIGLEPSTSFVPCEDSVCYSGVSGSNTRCSASSRRKKKKDPPLCFHDSNTVSGFYFRLPFCGEAAGRQTTR